jgi:hypothetical protein
VVHPRGDDDGANWTSVDGISVDDGRVSSLCVPMVSNGVKALTIQC